MIKKVLFVALLLIPFKNAFAQEDQGNLLTVYLDCRNCNSGFIRSEINFINFVSDQSVSEVHLIVTAQGTGSGGVQYTLNYIGQNQLETLSNQLIYNSYDSDTGEERRNGLVRYIKLGLIPFLTEKEALSNFDVTFSGSKNPVSNIQNNDKWKSWTFEIGGNTYVSGEESKTNTNINGYLRARRITDQWKIQFNYDQNIRREVYKNKDDSTGDISKSIYSTSSQSVWGLVGYSISDHWSIGSYMSGGSSSRDNIDLRFGGTPSIEYSFFPYREYARREVILRYGVFASFYDYTEQTIYNKDTEFLVRQELAFSMDLTKPWGSIRAGVNGRHYLHDFSKNRLNMNFRISARIVRGFSVFFNSYYSIINDQLSLSGAGLTEEEKLTNTKQQATSYSYSGSVGFSISFGSIYNNVVNTRF